MRAGKEESGSQIHISGAERIARREDLQKLTVQLLERAMTHPKGDPDNINIKIEALDPDAIVHLEALPVTTIQTASPEEGWRKAEELLQRIGVRNSREILALLPETYHMRGAMLLDLNGLKRLEPDHDRGVRATYMDYASFTGSAEKKKGSNTHFNEALVLATKVVSHPHIRAEICFSDDPDYVTGYVASREFGYVRITTMKDMGDPNGGRIFLYDGKEEDVQECIGYLQKQPVLIELKGNSSHE